MKKALKGLGIICLSTIILTGCGGGKSEKEDTLKDGTYYRYDDYLKVKLVIQGDEVLRTGNIEGDTAEIGEIKGKANIPYWTKEEFEKVVSQICISDYYQHLNFVMLWVYFTTGSRVNEACVFYWNDIDFEKKTIRIHHMLEIKNKENWVRKNYTKTENGKRIISLDDYTLQILMNWKKRQAQHCTSNFIFSYNGNTMQKSTIARIIERYAKLAGIHKIQSKGLRHSHASYLINEFNVDILMLSRRLGHSGPEITLKHYSHMYPNRDEVIANNITGNIKIETSQINQIKFTGNQNIKYDY
ncbi:site-specific integrase [Listeria sp. ILCC796]|uniref:site-specific integrase n=1 Tax=unclassified Listeria TaxID=2642072 RepID=UPI003517BED7